MRTRRAVCSASAEITGWDVHATRVTAKLHLAVEPGRNVLSIVVTVGRRGDAQQFELVRERDRVPHPPEAQIARSSLNA
ncbi:hypothetical protein [Streptomyces sp. NPDC014344]|uniref:hypothetical protein n=1 Tax=Streptomyces sp. NPDC014344 TaxID=3364871 RepID=UPI0037014A74